MSPAHFSSFLCWPSTCHKWCSSFENIGHGAGDYDNGDWFKTSSESDVSGPVGPRSNSKRVVQSTGTAIIPAGVSGYHVFISYRRTGVAVARSVKQELRSLGFNCFMDFEALRSGDFQQLLEDSLAGAKKPSVVSHSFGSCDSPEDCGSLPGTPVVVVILTPGCLTDDARWPGGGRNTKNDTSPGQITGDEPKDWLQHEVCYAQLMSKLIIPVRTSDFDLGKEFMAVPDDIGYLQVCTLFSRAHACLGPCGAPASAAQSQHANSTLTAR